jgi:hypothetical protein
MSRLKDLSNQRFGRLTVIKRADNLGHHTRWLCKCDCGNYTKSHTTSLTSGRAKSCGCLGREKATKSITTHGGRYTQLYSVWCGMKKRCYNKSYEYYNRYGGRGIKVCDEWRDDFAAFREWALNNGYRDGMEIDRIDNDSNYMPGNCRWATRSEQIKNRSNSITITHNGQTLPLVEWCNIYGIGYKLAHARYKKGWDFQKIFS